MPSSRAASPTCRDFGDPTNPVRLLQHHRAGPRHHRARSGHAARSRTPPATTCSTSSAPTAASAATSTSRVPRAPATPTPPPSRPRPSSACSAQDDPATVRRPRVAVVATRPPTVASSTRTASTTPTPPASPPRPSPPAAATTELASAQEFLASLQFDCSFADRLRGGIAFTAADYATLKATPDDHGGDRPGPARHAPGHPRPRRRLAPDGHGRGRRRARRRRWTAPTDHDHHHRRRPTSTTTTSSHHPGRPADPADPASAAPGALALTGTNVAAHDPARRAAAAGRRGRPRAGPAQGRARLMRLLARLVAVAGLVVAGGLALPGGAAQAAACTGTTGVTVVIDYGSSSSTLCAADAPQRGGGARRGRRRRRTSAQYPGRRLQDQQRPVQPDPASGCRRRAPTGRSSTPLGVARGPTAAPAWPTTTPLPAASIGFAFGSGGAPSSAPPAAAAQAGPSRRRSPAQPSPSSSSSKPPATTPKPAGTTPARPSSSGTAPARPERRRDRRRQHLGRLVGDQPGASRRRRRARRGHLDDTAPAAPRRRSRTERDQRRRGHGRRRGDAADSGSPDHPAGRPRPGRGWSAPARHTSRCVAEPPASEPVRAAGTPLSRHLHPVAWWVWAIGLAVACSRTSNPLLLLLAVAVASLVVAAKRGSSPWARAFRLYLVLGRVHHRAAGRCCTSWSGYKFGSTRLYPLPSVELPGITLLGPLYLEGAARRRRRGAAAREPDRLHRRGQRAGQPQAPAARPARAPCTRSARPSSSR